MWFLMCDFLLFIGSMQDTNGAACVKHLHRPPFISRAEIISVSSFTIFLHIWNLLSLELGLSFSKFDLEINSTEGLPIVNTFPNGNTV